VQDAQSHSVQVDPPGRVSRLSFIQGEVTMAPAGSDDWVDATLNRPVTSGDRVWTDDKARTELQVGEAAVDLDEHTGFSFVQLDDDVMQMSVTEGAATIRLHSRRDNEKIQVETPNGTVELLHPGEYHIEVNPDTDRTIVKTRSGEAEMVVDEKSYPVKAGEQGEFTGLEKVTANIDRIEPRNDFENWANERDQKARNSRSTKYVPEEVVGSEDLDDHGDWVQEPEYGYVWYPRYVVHDWAPYRDGRWVWVSPWGWTWVDNAPWGFAPFHYGRWVSLNRGWCWVPGPRYAHPVYSPAFVGWIGGPSVGVSVSIGPSVGWFPLGPREVYVPSYHYSPRYIRYINASNTVIVDNRQITNIYVGHGAGPSYRYWRNPNAVTVVPRDHFVRGAPVRDHIVRVNERELRDAQVHPRAPAIAPTRASLLAGRSITPVAARHIEREQIIASRAAAPRRVSFDDERRAIEANHGRPVDRSHLFTPTPIRTTRGGGIEPRGDVRAISPARPVAPNRDAVIQRGDARSSGAWNADRRNSEIARPGSNVISAPRTDDASSNSAGAAQRTPRDNGEREFRNTPTRPDRGIESSRPNDSRTNVSPANSAYERYERSTPRAASPSFEQRDSIQSRPTISQPAREIQRSDDRRIESRPEISRPQISRQEISRPQISRQEISRPQISQPEPTRSEARPEIHRDDNRGSDRASRGGADRDNGNRRDR
jgi:hypothetical protein